MTPIIYSKAKPTCLLFNIRNSFNKVFLEKQLESSGKIESVGSVVIALPLLCVYFDGRIQILLAFLFLFFLV